LRGTLLGVFLLIGFDSIVTPLLDTQVFQARLAPWAIDTFNLSAENAALKFSNWRLLVFGIPLILMMRFRPEGLLPAATIKRELHPTDSSAVMTAGAR
jgi:branched-chain amino acid transport system permease protein